jgi:hypothetical protein
MAACAVFSAVYDRENVPTIHGVRNIQACNIPPAVSELRGRIGAGKQSMGGEEVGNTQILESARVVQGVVEWASAQC